MKKKRIIVTSLVIGAILLIAGAGTYAYWQLTKVQENTNDIIAACLDFELTNAGENTGISLTNAWPVSDTEGLSSTDNEYSFKVTNKCADEVYYEIALEKYDGTTSLSSESIVVGLDNKKVGILNNLQDRTAEDADATSAKLIGSGTVNGNSTNTHSLKLWISATAPITEQGKTFSGKVYITGGQGITKQESPIEIIDGDINTVGSEIAIGTEHFYVIESNDNEVELLTKYNLLVGRNTDTDSDEQKCADDAGEYRGSGWCFLPEMPPTTEGYNKQSENAIGYWCEDFENREGCSITATVPFATYDENCGQKDCDEYGYWWDDEKDDYLDQYKPVGTQQHGYVYDEDNEYNTISTYVKNYKNILETEYNLEVKETKLMNFEKAIELLECTYNEKDYDCTYPYGWAYNTSYWLGSANDTRGVWDVFSDGSFSDSGFGDPNFVGVRPIIVLDKSKI